MQCEIDARGLSCPLPVVETSKALRKTQGGTILVIVDNATARDNVVRLARGEGWAPSVEEREGDYYVTIRKG